MTQLLQQVGHAISVAIGRLSPREQRLVAILGILTAVAALYVGVVEPVVDARGRTEKRIAQLSSDLTTMDALARRIASLEPQVRLDSDAAAADADFSLFSFMDRATSASVDPDAIASMNPARHQVREGIEESTVELRLTTVSLSEVVGLLRKIELAEHPVYVKKVELKRRYDDHTRFDVILIAGALSRT